MIRLDGGTTHIIIYKIYEYSKMEMVTVQISCKMNGATQVLTRDNKISGALTSLLLESMTILRHKRWLSVNVAIRGWAERPWHSIVSGTGEVCGSDIPTAVTEFWETIRTHWLKC